MKPRKHAAPQAPQAPVHREPAPTPAPPPPTSPVRIHIDIEGSPETIRQTLAMIGRRISGRGPDREVRG